VQNRSRYDMVADETSRSPFGAATRNAVTSRLIPPPMTA
jgi:hypothetical protein